MEKEQGFGIKKDKLSLLKDWRVVAGLVVLAVISVTIIVTIIVGGANLVLKNITEGLVPTQTQTPTPTPPPLLTATVFITDSGFVPEKLEAKLGTTLTFLNITGRGFDIRSKELSELNLKVPSGQTKELKLTKAGTYSYESSNNPDVKGTIVVK